MELGFFCHHSAKIRPKSIVRKSEYKNAQENASERKPKMQHPPNWYLMDEKQKQVDDIVGGDCESHMADTLCEIGLDFRIVLA